MRVHARTGIILALSVGMLAWFLRGANLREVWTEIQNGRVGLLALAVGITGMTYVFRALRWQYLLRPLGNPPFGAVFRTTVIGFAASTLLPARAGEVVRPYLLARRSGFSATSAFATIILERLLDLVTVLLLFGFYLAFYTPAVAAGHSSTFTALKSGGLLAAIASRYDYEGIKGMAAYTDGIATTVKKSPECDKMCDMSMGYPLERDNDLSRTCSLVSRSPSSCSRCSRSTGWSCGRLPSYIRTIICGE